MNVDQELTNSSNSWVIEKTFVEEVLSPYKENATYLKDVSIDDSQHSPKAQTKNRKPVSGSLLTAIGSFEIPESCYIDDTGHFNAVEFNICFNQLAYVMFGECFRRNEILTRVAPDLADQINLGYDGFRTHQLSSMFIVKYESRFKQQIDSNLFYGELSVQRVSVLSDTYFAHTSIRFYDDVGGHAEGKVLLAFTSQSTH